jgi:predicted PurR-regulated permease PerM
MQKARPLGTAVARTSAEVEKSTSKRAQTFLAAGSEFPHGRVALVVLATCAVIVMLRYGAPVLLPTVIAMLLFYMLDPVVKALERLRVPRGLGAPLVVMALVGAIAMTALVLWPQIESVVAKIPEGAAQVRTQFLRARRSPVDTPLERVQAAANAVDSAAAAAGGTTATTPGVMKVEIQQPFRVSTFLWTGGVGLMVSAGQAVAVLFLTIFLLYEGDLFKRKLVAGMDGLGSKRVTVQILNDIASQIGRFIWVQCATSALVALATTLALWSLGLESPIVWGVIAGVMNIVPYFGPLIVSALLAIVALLQFGNLVDAGTVAGVSLLITTFEGMFLTPHLLTKAASLNHVAVFLAITFFSWAWGVPGMLLAVPVLMVMKAITDHVDGLQDISSFLSS